MECTEQLVSRRRHSLTGIHQHTTPVRQVPPLFDKEETRERLRKLPGGAAQPLTVRRLACLCAACCCCTRAAPLAPTTQTLAPTYSTPLIATPHPRPQVHLRQEIDRLNVVLAATRSTLTDLRLAIAGAQGGLPAAPPPALACRNWASLAHR